MVLCRKYFASLFGMIPKVGGECKGRRTECVAHSTPRPRCLFLQRNRRNRIQYPRHLIRCHLTALQTTHLTALSQFLQPKSQFPALGLVDEEDVFPAISIADRCAENVEVFRGLYASLS